MIIKAQVCAYCGNQSRYHIIDKETGKLVYFCKSACENRWRKIVKVME